MQFYLCGCLTDLVSKSETGQNVNQSRMEIEREWLSNHPNLFLSFFFSPLFSSCVLQLCCSFWASQEVLEEEEEEERMGWRQGEVAVLLSPGMGG